MLLPCAPNSNPTHLLDQGQSKTKQSKSKLCAEAQQNISTTYALPTPTHNATWVCECVYVSVHDHKMYILSPQNKQMALLLLMRLPAKKNRYFRRKKDIWKMRASMEFAAAATGAQGKCQAKESERARIARERRTRMPHYKCSSHLHEYIKRHIYYIMEKQQSGGHEHTYTLVCIRIRERQNQPSQACVRPTVWPKAEQTNQNRSEANRTEPHRTESSEH